MAITRFDPPASATERETLEAFLDYHRATLSLKCDGLSDEQLRERAVAPSTLSLLGLVRHMADVERSWFRRVMDGQDAPPLYYSDSDPDGDFDNTADDTAASALAAWAREIAASREVVAGIDVLDTMSTAGHRLHGNVSLRWVLCHMLEEYARHNGHADLLRERIDGATGE